MIFKTTCALPVLVAACLSAVPDTTVSARDLYKQGNYRAALQRYEETVFEASNPALIWFNMANCWYQLDSLTNAAVCYEMALEKAPGFFRVALKLGILKYTLEDYPGVIALFESARFLEPENTQLLQILASAYLRLEATAKAIPLLEQALSIDANSERYYFLLYDANYRLGNLYDAARWAFYRYTALLAQQETALLALEEADGTLERFPDFGELSLLAGTIATEQGLYDRTARYFMHVRDH